MGLAGLGGGRAPAGPCRANDVRAGAARLLPRDGAWRPRVAGSTRVPAVAGRQPGSDVQELPDGRMLEA